MISTRIYSTALLLSAFSFHAFAGTATATFNVTASVVAKCTIAATSPASLAYDPMSGTAITGNGSLAIKCSKGTVANVDMSQGGGCTSGSRCMKSATTGSTLNYSILQPPSNTPGSACTGATTPWSSGSGTFKLTAAGNSSARNYNVCISIPAGQDPSVASDYTDSVTATVNF